ncbi:MAG: hypothetical protein ABJG47_10120 [Ekhidna sp.]
MKKIKITVLFLAICFTSYTQTNTFPTTGFVGIGTTSPNEQLEVAAQGRFFVGDGGGASRRGILLQGTGTYTRIVAHDYGISTGIDLVLQDTGGKVGIGTTSPTQLIDLLSVNRAIGQFRGSHITDSYFTIGNTSSGHAKLVLDGQNGDAFGGDYATIYNVNSSNATDRHLRFQTNATDRMTIDGSGNIGIGTTTPLNKLDIRLGNSYGYTARFSEQNGAGIILGVDPNNDEPLSGFIGHTSSNRNINYAVFGIGKHVFKTDAGASMAISNTGNVGIGTTTPQSKLAVEGQIRATEVKVLADISVPDYVFEPDYKLRTLEETKKYIAENKHLPEIPSAAEIGENGIDLGDMNMKLLKKVEELTLYMIDMNEQVQLLKSENTELKEKVKVLEKE